MRIVNNVLDARVKLFNSFKPFVFSLHMHDVNVENIKKLRNLKIPIISQGNTINSDFVDNFYANISNFMYSTSPDIGTHTWLCEDFGVNFFVFGSSKNQKNYREIYPPYKNLETIFSLENVENKKIKEEYLDIFLGRNSDMDLHWDYSTSELLIDFLKLLPQILTSYFMTILRLIIHPIKKLSRPK